MLEFRIFNQEKLRLYTAITVYYRRVFLWSTRILDILGDYQIDLDLVSYSSAF